MGQKVNPIGLRLGITKNWVSNWYADKEYSNFLQKDQEVRSYLFKKLKNAGLVSIEIEKANKSTKINIYSVRPGTIIGKKGEDADKLKFLIEKRIGSPVALNIKEVKRPDINASYIAQYIVSQLERRIAFRRVMKKAIQNAQRFKVDGCKIMISGRLNGAEMARREWIREGRVPLHTLKANIDYAFFEAHTAYGLIGIKVWTYFENNNSSYKKFAK